MIADFTKMPFADGAFRLVVFDPPHFKNPGNGTIAACYGKLPTDWEAMLRYGFSECFRVLRGFGVLIFKWAEKDIAMSDVLALTDAKPLFGHRSGKHTHWVVFMKEAA